MTRTLEERGNPAQKDRHAEGDTAGARCAVRGGDPGQSYGPNAVFNLLAGSSDAFDKSE